MGTAIVGFRSYHYKMKADTKEMSLTGLVSRANAITLYLNSGFDKERIAFGIW